MGDNQENNPAETREAEGMNVKIKIKSGGNMKKLILVTLFTILAVSMSFGEGLGVNAQNIKKMSPDGYVIIKAMAADKWESDHSMVLYEINEQCDSLVKVIQLLFDGGDLNIFARAVAKWSVHGNDISNVEIIVAWAETGDISSVFEIIADWNMVLYEYENQISAASSY